MSKPESKYAPMYKVMLILSTIGTAFGVIGLFSLPELLAALDQSRLYVTCAVLLCANTLVSIAALVLLWQKNHTGYLLKLSTYLVVIVACAVSLFGVDSYSEYSVNKSLEQLTSEGVNSPEIERMTRVVIPAATKASIVIGIVQAGVFALLWRTAWKKQVLYDKENS